MRPPPLRVTQVWDLGAALVSTVVKLAVSSDSTGFRTVAVDDTKDYRWVSRTSPPFSLSTLLPRRRRRSRYPPRALRRVIDGTVISTGSVAQC